MVVLPELFDTGATLFIIKLEKRPQGSPSEGELVMWQWFIGY